MMCGPRIETPSLLLAPHEQADFEFLAVMWADPDVVRYNNGKPASE